MSKIQNHTGILKNETVSSSSYLAHKKLYLFNFQGKSQGTWMLGEGGRDKGERNFYVKLYIINLDKIKSNNICEYTCIIHTSFDSLNNTRLHKYSITD